MKFWNCIRSQFYLMVHNKNFWFSFWCMFLYSCITYLYQVVLRQDVNTSDMLQGSSLFLGWGRAPFSKYFVILFPFVLTITFSFSYFEENVSNVCLYSILRVGNKRYYFAKLFVGFAGNFLIVVIPYFINIFLNFITFAENGNTVYGNKIDSIYYRNLIPGTHMPFLEVYMKHEIFYIIMYTLYLGCLGGVLGVFSCSVSGFIKKNKVFIFVPLYLLFYISQRYSRYLFGINLERYILLDAGGYSSSYCLNILLFVIFIVLCSVLAVGILVRRKKYQF